MNLTWAKDHELIVGAVCLLILMGLSFATGRYLAPDKVITKVQKVAVDAKHEEQTHVEQKTDAHQQEQQQTKTVTKVIYRDRIVHPDGTQETHEVEKSVDASADLHLDFTTAVATSVAQAEKDETHLTLSATSKTVERSRPSWRVGALVGLEIEGFHPVYGALVERRLLGPISGGAWGLSNGSAGVALTVEF